MAIELKGIPQNPTYPVEATRGAKDEPGRQNRQGTKDGKQKKQEQPEPESKPTQEHSEDDHKALQASQPVGSTTVVELLSHRSPPSTPRVNYKEPAKNPKAGLDKKA